MRVLSLATAFLATALSVTASMEESEGRALRGMSEDSKRSLAGGEDGLVGAEFLQGIRNIVSTDPQVPRNEVITKPFMGSFTTIKSEGDPALASTSYCLTDNGCGNPLAYTTTMVPLAFLGCNSFCYIDKNSRTFHRSQVYTTSNPPPSYLCCSWASC